jgi:TetR/AcrR family transcriptional regulator
LPSNIAGKAARDEILAATMDIIFENSISGTRIRLIAERLGISPGLVSYHFPSKKDLYIALLDELIEYYHQQTAFILDQAIKPEEKLMIMVYKQVEFISKRREYYVIFDFWVQSSNDAEIREKVTEVFSNWKEINARIMLEGVESGVFDEAGAKLAPEFLISLITGAAVQYLLDQDVFNLQAHFDEIYKILNRLLKAETLEQPA